MLENPSHWDFKKIYVDVSSWASLIWKSPVKSVLDLKPFECHVDASKALDFRAIWILDFRTKDAQPSILCSIWEPSMRLLTFTPNYQHFTFLWSKNQEAKILPSSQSKQSWWIIDSSKVCQLSRLCSDETFILGHNKELETMESLIKEGDNEGGYLKWRNI